MPQPKPSCSHFPKRWRKKIARCPGVTETNFFEAAKIQRPPARIAQTPEAVVDTALRALARGKSSVISGWTNFMMVQAERLTPRSVVTRIAGTMLRKTLGGKEQRKRL